MTYDDITRYCALALALILSGVIIFTPWRFRR